MTYRRWSFKVSLSIKIKFTLVRLALFRRPLFGQNADWDSSFFAQLRQMNINVSTLLLIRDLHENCSYHWSYRPRWFISS